MKRLRSLPYTPPAGPCASSASGYYAWYKRVHVLRKEPVLTTWQVAAQRVFTTHAGRYGQRRLRAQLRREGHAVGRQRLRGWLTASGLWALLYAHRHSAAAHHPS